MSINSKDKQEEHKESVINVVSSQPEPPDKRGSIMQQAANKIVVVNRITRLNLSVAQKQRLSILPSFDLFRNRFPSTNRFKKIFIKQRLLSAPALRIRSFIVFLLIIILTAAAIWSSINYNLSPYYISYVVILGFVFTLLLFLDYWDIFHQFQSKFENSCNGYSQTIFLITFCLIAFIDYIIIGLEEDGILSGDIIILIIDVLYYISVFLFLCTFMAYWKTFSFYCSEKSIFHAIFYLTIIGYLIILICRWLRPVSEINDDQDEIRKNKSSWHKKHDIKSILSSIMYIIIFLFIFCVFLGGICIALFAEFARQSAEYGVGIAIFGFCTVSMFIMLTPLAPGSIVDACGGFVFIQLLSNPNNGPNYSFFISWLIGIISVSILHFIGSCSQWYIGKLPCVQIWANKTLPIEMLAASDAVLRDAGIIKVGLVGCIFMDTANGLNQGRINMNFWIQLLSEWTSLPNALGLVSLGSAIAAQALLLPNMEWTIIAVPLFLLFSTLTQSAAATFGAKAMGDSTDTVKYWTAREKWIMFQFFVSQGITPTKLGWKQDVFNLANINDKYKDKFNTKLFEMVAPLHAKYLRNRENAKDSEERLKIFEEYRLGLIEIREIHYDNFEGIRDEYIKEGWLIYEKPKSSSNGFFAIGENDTHDLSKWKITLWSILCIIATFAFWGSFYGIYLQSSLQAAVQQGIATLNSVTQFSWLCCAVFGIVVLFVYHIEIFNASKSFFSILTWICIGCDINQEIETKFYTPKYEVVPQEFEFKKDDD